MHPGFPIILYSGYGGHMTPEEASRMGFWQFLAKPFQPHTLAEAVKEALAQAKT